MKVDLTKVAKEAFREVPEADMENVLGGYIKLMNPPKDADEITMSPDEVRQTGMLAAVALANILYERVKRS